MEKVVGVPDKGVSLVARLDPTGKPIMLGHVIFYWIFDY